jgi:hypothetical protein
MAGRLACRDDASIVQPLPETPMNSSLRPRVIVHHSVPRVQPPSDGIAVAVDDGSEPACGWYESSFALRQGLAVSELTDSDGSVAALWFAALREAEIQDAWPAASLQ